MSIEFAKSQLVLGGARSGKTRFAQEQTERLPGELFYLATAQALDEEMADRISRHQAERGARWRTVEAPIDLAGAIRSHSEPGNVLLVDCLTLWLSNLMLAELDPVPAIQGLLAAIADVPGKIILVSNEVGLGIVPDNALARRFRDSAGIVNQTIAQIVSSVIFVTAGLPIVVK